MAPTTLLDKFMVETRLKRHGPVSWLISRIASREQQESVIRVWNETGALPGDIEDMPRLAPAGNSAWRRTAL